MGGPQLLVVEDYSELSVTGASLVAEVVAERPGALVAAATGRTPMGLYADLAMLVRLGRADLSGVTAVQVDEYLGLEPGDRRSLYGWMERSFLAPLSIDKVLRLPVDGDVDGAAAGFDRQIEARGGLDLAILGLGPNGHLGFNEPPSPRTAPTRRVRLTPESIESNARYWGTDVPAEAVTLGMAPLMVAAKILLVVSGEAKRSILHRALEGEVGPEVPASFLQEARDVTVLADREAWGEG